MTAPRVIFARHGESTANLARTFANRGISHPLTEAGIAQANELSVRLRGHGVVGVRTSPLLRAIQTAEIVANALGFEAAVDESLCEFDVGKWEGTSSLEGWAEYREVTAAWATGDHNARVGGGESLAEIVRRTEPFFSRLVEYAPPGGTILCIGHGGAYRAALPERLVNMTYEFAFTHPFPNTGRVVAEVREGQLFCIEWCGTEPPVPA